MGALFAPGDPIETLELLDDLGVTVTLDRPTGQLHVRPRPVDAVAAELIRANRPLIHAVLLGERTGHAWARCDACGEGRMVAAGKSPRCAMTPGCEGRHIDETDDDPPGHARRRGSRAAPPGPEAGGAHRRARRPRP